MYKRCSIKTSSLSRIFCCVLCWVYDSYWMRRSYGRIHHRLHNIKFLGMKRPRRPMMAQQIVIKALCAKHLLHTCLRCHLDLVAMCDPAPHLRPCRKQENVVMFACGIGGRDVTSCNLWKIFILCGQETPTSLAC